LKGVIALLSRNTTATIGTGELMGVVGARARIATRKRSISMAVRRKSRSDALPITVSDGVFSRFQSRLQGPEAPVVLGDGARNRRQRQKEQREGSETWRRHARILLNAGGHHM
jgi:hypothetical protein